jgi:hypothetical protein
MVLLFVCVRFSEDTGIPRQFDTSTSPGVISAYFLQSYITDARIAMI